MIELFAALATLLCVWLTSKVNIFSWPVGLIGILLYSYIFYTTKLYADLCLQTFFLGQTIYGWYNWSHNKHENIIEIGRMNKHELITSIFLFLFISTLFSFIFSNYTKASLPYVDSHLSAVCISATYLLSKRKYESWFLWIYADCIYVFLFLYKGLYISSVLYFILFFIAIKGLITWKKQLDEKIIN